MTARTRVVALVRRGTTGADDCSLGGGAPVGYDVVPPRAAAVFFCCGAPRTAGTEAAIALTARRSRDEYDQRWMKGNSVFVVG
jgi:hypothetical protein